MAHTQIVTDVYTFDLLSDKAKEKARDWYRQASDGDAFGAECVIEDAEEMLKHAGWDISKIYYSGFSSQGDGACFEGAWSAKAVNVAAMKDNAPLDTELHRIAEELAKVAAAFPLSSGGVKQSGHYYHEHCTRFDFEPGDDEACEDIIYQSEEDKAHSALVSSVEDDFIEASRDAMRWIYRQLEKDWEFQNSDETVDENILVNEYTFTEAGKRFG
jgi:hypothetical protein